MFLHICKRYISRSFSCLLHYHIKSLGKKHEYKSVLLHKVCVEINKEINRKSQVEGVLELINGSFEEARVLIEELQQIPFSLVKDVAISSLQELLSFQENYYFVFELLLFSFEQSKEDKKHFLQL